MPMLAKPLFRPRLWATLVASLMLLTALQPVKASAAPGDLLELQLEVPQQFLGTPLTLPISGTFTGLQVDWGDGTAIEAFNSGTSIRHVYPNSAPLTMAPYTVRVISVATGSIDNFGQVGGWEGVSSVVGVTEWNNIHSFRGAFDGSMVQSVPAALPIGVTDTSYMFANTDFNGDISAWDTSAVQNMESMFSYGQFNSNISNWDTSNVTDMSNMFEHTPFNRNISSWQTGSVTNMSQMFSLASYFNQPIGNWDVSSVTDISGMFYNAVRFNQPLNNWNTSNVVNMSSTFQMIEGGTVFNQPLNNWNTSSVTNMSHMFDGAVRFNKPLDNWNTSSVTDFSHMFDGAFRFDGDISTWDTSAALTMAHMFADASAFSGSLSNWDVSNLVDASYMFVMASSFSSDLSAWQTPHLVNLNNTFNGAPVDFNLGAWDVSNVTNVSGALTSTNLTAENYSATLIGWSAQSVQPNLVMDSMRYYVEEPQTMSAITILSDSAGANWIFTADIPYYPITFDINGASGTTPIYVSVPGYTVDGLPDDTGFSKTGFTFGGWTDGATTYAAFDAFITNAPGSFFTAIWTPVGAVANPVTFDINGGTGTTPAALSNLPGVTFTLPSSSSFSKAAFAFTGWSDGSTTYTAGQSYVMGSAALNFVAQWQAVIPVVPVVVPPAPQPDPPVMVTLDPAGGSTIGIPATRTILPGTVIELPKEVDVVKPGYTLEGWHDGSRIYPAGSKYPVGNKPVAFTAAWKKVKLPQVIPSPKLRAVFYPGMSLTMPTKTDVGLTIAYSASDEASSGCSITTAGLVRILGGGDCNVVANQPGNDDYLAAETVTIPVNVDPTPSKVRKILFRFVGKRAVLSSGSALRVKNYVDYVNALLADSALALRINVRSYFKIDGSITALSKQRKAAMRQALVAAGLPLGISNRNLEVHLYFSPGYHARYSWASVPEVRVVG
jgi:surface protein